MQETPITCDGIKFKLNLQCAGADVRELGPVLERYAEACLPECVHGLLHLPIHLPTVARVQGIL